MSRDHHPKKDDLSPLPCVALIVASNKVDVRVVSIHPSNQIANIYWVICQTWSVGVKIGQALAFQQLTDL